MISRSNVRLGLTGALLLMAMGAFSGCTESSPTDIEVSEESREECIIIDSQWYCKS